MNTLLALDIISALGIITFIVFAVTLYKDSNNNEDGNP
jgi:hypothetical protein